MTLADELEAAGVDDVTIVGFATDHCVKATALDARELGLNVTVALDLCAGVAPETHASGDRRMTTAGVEITASKDT